MTPIIAHAFVLAMAMQAINAVFSEGMLFSIPGAWLEGNAHFLWKMLMGCPVCMCPWYGAACMLAFNLTPVIAVSILVAMGINWVIGFLIPAEDQHHVEIIEDDRTENTSSL